MSASNQHSRLLIGSQEEAQAYIQHLEGRVDELVEQYGTLRVASERLLDAVRTLGHPELESERQLRAVLTGSNPASGGVGARTPSSTGAQEPESPLDRVSPPVPSPASEPHDA